MLLGALLIVGCEGDSSGGAGSGHDFGANDPSLAVALGDSITAGTGIGGAAAWPAQLSARSGKTVINMGVGGQTSAGGLGRVGSALAAKPGFLLILFGSNDISQGVDLNGTKENLREIIRAAKANQTVPIIGSVPNGFGSHAFMQPGVKTLNGLIESLAREEGVRVAAVAGAIGNNAGLLQSDGLHPTVAGSGKIAGAFAREL
jgi:lysophospholipase L1-like esterase